MNIWKGIDVSDNQGAIDHATVAAAGCDFVVLRSTRGSGKADNRFTENLAGFLAAGLPVDVYKYTYATTVARSREEASLVIELLKKHGHKCKVWWDVEDAALKLLGSAQLTACIHAAKEVIESAGYRFGLYVGQNVYKEKWLDFNQFATNPLWVARYPSSKTISFGTEPDEKYLPVNDRAIWGWQFSSTGRVPGISGNADLDICYQDPAETGLPTAEQGVIWCVSIADVWAEPIAKAVAVAYPGCLVHHASVLDVGGINIWIASIADVWTQEQAEVVHQQFAALGIAGVVHKVQILE